MRAHVGREQAAPSARPDTLLVDILLTVAVVVGILLYLLTAVPGYYGQASGGDYPYYVQMAERPLTNAAPSPWRYRLLNPWLASWLVAAGLTMDAAFLTLTAMFAVVSCVLMKVYLQQLGLSPFAARAGLLLFALSVGAYVPLRRYYGYTDALTNFFTLLVLVCAMSRLRVATAAALGVGTLAKESMLLLVPFLVTRIRRFAGWPATAMIAMVPIVVFLSLRLFVPRDPSGTAPVALTWTAQVEYWQTAMIHGVVRWILWAFAYSMGPVWVIAALAARHNWPFIRGYALLLLPLAVPLARTTDTERALMLAFPLVYPLAAWTLDTLRGSRFSIGYAALAIACTGAAQLTFDWSAELRIGVVNAKDIVFIILCVLPALPLVLAARRPTIPLRTGIP